MSQNITNGITKCAEGNCCKENCQQSPGFLNNPPADGRCNCCGKHLGELKPFSLMGQASRTGLEEVLLVKNMRPMASLNEEMDRILERFVGDCLTAEDHKKAEERLNEVFGKETAEDLLLYYNASILSTISWECRECIDLDNEAYCEMRDARHSQEPGDRISLKPRRDGATARGLVYHPFGKRRLIRQEQTSLQPGKPSFPSQLTLLSALTVKGPD